MKAAIQRRLKALETKGGKGYRPFRVVYFHGPSEDHEQEVAEEAAKAEVNGEQFFPVFFVSAAEQS
ncbi:MAG TPA: hypothetical protein QGI03_02855 [Dehalococcoidia bacterium]|jgi:hypothetical protein|nr:hypothetical protein [Dehalococcoidia bacterium]|tara:strand:+ start:32 stop:229 length:198 start_codon:yes stop_codon:yes gene_type:complete